MTLKELALFSMRDLVILGSLSMSGVGGAEFLRSIAHTVASDNHVLPEIFEDTVRERLQSLIRQGYVQHYTFEGAEACYGLTSAGSAYLARVMGVLPPVGMETLVTEGRY